MEATEKTQRLYFKNPPIVEAAIAISIPSQSNALNYERASAAMNSAGYEKSEPVNQHQFEMKVSNGLSSANTTDIPVGMRYSSTHSPYVIQFLLNAFSFSRLKPYTTWDEFRTEAHRVWRIYADAAGTNNALSVGVRYTNKVFIPFGANPRDYVLASVELPDSISAGVTEMFMRIETPISSPPGRFILTQAKLPDERPGFATILLDNDFQFPTLGMSIDEIWQMLEIVRQLKDDYFIQLTTSKLRETFDE